MEAIQFGRQGSFDGFLAVGGGSVMDSAKVANLFSCYPESDLMDFVAPPFGKATPILKQLKPLICGESGWVCAYVCPGKWTTIEGRTMKLEVECPYTAYTAVFSDCILSCCSSHYSWHW